LIDHPLPERFSQRNAMDKTISTIVNEKTAGKTGGFGVWPRGPGVQKEWKMPN
jgi:hypothetical protein